MGRSDDEMKRDIQINSFQGEALIGGIPFSQWMRSLPEEERRELSSHVRHEADQCEQSEPDDAA